jgi:hypothetical protein
MKRKLVTGEIPKFEGPITSISTPVQLEHKPAKYNFTLTQAVKEGDKRIIERSLRGSSTLSPLGDLLVWEVKVSTIKVGRSRVTPDVPIVASRILTNKYGEFNEQDLSFPALEKIDSAPAEGTRDFNEMFNLIKYVFLGFPLGFPTEPVRSGDIIIIPRAKALKRMQNALPQLRRWSGGEDIEVILKGRSYLNGKRVFVAGADETFVLTAPHDETEMRVKYSMYTILDEETYRTLKREALISIEHYDENENIIKEDSAKSLVSFSQYIK